MTEELQLSFRVFGSVGATGPGGEARLGGRLRQLLAALLVRRDSNVPYGELIAMLWGPASEPAGASAALRQHVTRLRAALRVVAGGAVPLYTTPGGYRLEVNAHGCDVDRFAVALAAARDQPSPGGLRDALSLVTGPAFGPFASEPWCRAEAGRIDDLVAGATDNLAALLVAGDWLGEAVSILVPQFERDPGRERTTLLLAGALNGAGRRAEALRCLHRHGRVLADVSGLDPTTAVSDLQRRLLAGTERTAHRPAAKGRSGTELVGRDEELAWLREVMSSAGRRLAVVHGPAGIGKSRLVDTFAVERAANGIAVLRGECDADVAHPLGPLAQAVRRFVEQAPSAQAEIVREALGARDRFLLGLDAEEVPVSATADELIRLAEVVGDALSALAEAAPVLVVVEDVHWIGATGATLLRLVASPPRAVPLGIVLTHRDEPADATAAGAVLLRRLGRLEGQRRLALTTLGPDAVRRLAVMALGEDGRRLAPMLLERAGGHPLLTRALLDELAVAGDAAELPVAVSSLVGDRMARLSLAHREVVERAAVIGRQFRFAELIDCGVDRGALVAALDDATALQLVRLTEPIDGRYEFAHQLIHEAVVAGLPPARRFELHATAATGLASAEPWIVARHCWLSGPLAGPNVIDSCRDAARSLTERLAHDSAAELFGWAVAAHRVHRPDDLHGRCDLLVSQGEALSLAGVPHRVDVLEEGWQLASSLKDWPLAARALSHLIPMRGMIATPIEERAAARAWELVDALVQAGHVDQALSLAAAAADRLVLVAVPDHVKALARTRAANATDPIERLTALAQLGRMLVGADDLHERVLTTQLMVGADSPQTLALLRYEAFVQHGNSAVLQGRLDEAAVVVTRAAEIARELRQPQLALEPMFIETGIALARGELTRVDSVVSALPDKPDPDDPFSGLMTTTRETVRFALAFERGGVLPASAKIIELADMLGHLPASPVATRVRAVWEIVIAHNAAMDGELTLASGHLARSLERADLNEVRDSVWLIGLGAQGYLAWKLHRRDLGATIYELALPYAQWNTWNGVVSMGPIHRALGLCAASIGRWDDAEAHLGEARACSHRWGMPCNEALVALELAEIRAQAKRPPAPTRRLAREALALADSVGSTRTASLARDLLARRDGTAVERACCSRDARFGFPGRDGRRTGSPRQTRVGYSWMTVTLSPPGFSAAVCQLGANKGRDQSCTPGSTERVASRCAG